MVLRGKPGQTQCTATKTREAPPKAMAVRDFLCCTNCCEQTGLSWMSRRDRVGLGQRTSLHPPLIVRHWHRPCGSSLRVIDLRRFITNFGSVAGGATAAVGGRAATGTAATAGARTELPREISVHVFALLVRPPPLFLLPGGKIPGEACIPRVFGGCSDSSLSFNASNSMCDLGTRRARFSCVG